MEMNEEKKVMLSSHYNRDREPKPTTHFVLSTQLHKIETLDSYTG